MTTTLIEPPSTGTGKRRDAVASAAAPADAALHASAAASVAASIAAAMAAPVEGMQAAPAAFSPPVAVPPLARLRARKRELVLLALAASCVLAFASWLGEQLRPALTVRESNERRTEERELDAWRLFVEPCVPGTGRESGRASTSWCGTVFVPPPPPPPPEPARTGSGAPLAFCVAGKAPSC